MIAIKSINVGIPVDTLRIYLCIGMKIMKNLRTGGISVHIRTNRLLNAFRLIQRYRQSEINHIQYTNMNMTLVFLRVKCDNVIDFA